MATASNPVSQTGPRVAAVAAGEHSLRLQDGLLDAGFDAIAGFDLHMFDVERIRQTAPDVVLMDLGEPDDAVFACALAVVRGLDCPTVMFIDRTDRTRTDAAIAAGVSLYIVDGFKVERLPAIVEVAMARHQARARVLSALAAGERERIERAIIDQAKNILMTRNRMAEDIAYSTLRKKAMNENRRLVEVARLVIDAARVEQPQEAEK